MKSFPFRYDYQGIILAPGDVRYNPTDDLIFPSVIKMEGRIERPLDRYYLYYAPHDAPGGICLATAGEIPGPWKEYGSNPIVTRDWPPHYQVSHISSPHVLWMEFTQRFHLYFHGENDTTRLATSTDGLHFDYVGVVVSTGMYDRISEASYARVFPCRIAGKDTAYVILFMGNNEGTRRLYAAWSQDGIHFTAEPEPLVSPPPGTDVTQVGGPWYLTHEGRHFILFHGDKTPPDLSNVTSHIYAVEMSPDFATATHLGSVFNYEIVSPGNRRASDPCLFEDAGQSWLFLAVGKRLHQTIALAKQCPVS